MELPAVLVAMASGPTEEVRHEFRVRESIGRQREARGHLQSCRIKFWNRSNVITKPFPCLREAEASQRKGVSGFEAESSQVVSCAAALLWVGGLQHG